MLGWAAVLLSSSCAAEAECGVAFKVLGEELPGCFKLRPNHSEVVQPGAHRKLWILCLNGLRAGALDFLCVCAQREAELDEGLQPTTMNPVLLAISWRQKIISAELDGLSEYSDKRYYPNKFFIRRLS